MSTTMNLNNSQPWVSDQGDGTFINPVLHADYSDPDVIRVGEDFYMTASSFSHLPGLPILHSKDLINWKLINHVMQSMDLPGYDKPHHGKGVWAPSIRFHNGKFWIYYGDPDVGIFMTTADDPAGQWTPLHLVKEGKGLIDTCPFWDEDGQAYLVHAFAHSRCGIKSKLNLCRMSLDGKSLLDDGQIIFDGTVTHPTLEGPKMYKRNGYYYMFAPAGGVPTGWQMILRSKSVFGPYEDRIVLHQGDSPVNGPHQGGWVELDSGESWFLHFQDKDAYGRIIHLQPVNWVDDWPLMGEDSNGDGIGEPVLRFKKPDVGREYPVETPVTSDGFDDAVLGLQWQWQANPKADWYKLGERQSHLRLYAAPLPSDAATLYDVPQLLLQKFPALRFQATAKLDCHAMVQGDKAGLIIFGYSYAYLGLRRSSDEDGGGLILFRAEGDAKQETVLWYTEAAVETVYLRVSVEENALCSFSFSTDGTNFTAVDGPAFQAREGHWVGAKAGLFAIHDGTQQGAGGFIDVDWFQVTGL
ncbi:glycoside hydrolase 43 family protein [Paenibacillus sp. sptzw28]|uniref:glycoside hydrolase family 43 protein n=1 Tax=Paenibacillus sp. sptzw28 TaxID=715179 RepID=UPI001C6F2DEE|nr:glycoside hydrolase 43 family protein [Paenibacillus sp. sptzw28]QYR23595.1 glycoside hydrolase 43 family protein [Paenibacillus sp. sptzw28]